MVVVVVENQAVYTVNINVDGVFYDRGTHGAIDIA